MKSGSVDAVLTSTVYRQYKKLLEASGCDLCPDLCKNRHHIVVDRGNDRSQVMVIGEAPGETEDLQGKAFIGRAGRMFDQVMESIGINTNQDLFIANILKCRPPKNRRPTAQEAANCRPYLDKQIKLVNPKLIILLGSTALKHMDPSKKKFSMKAEVGRFFQLKIFIDVQFIVLYHPAALLYNPRLKPIMKNHCQKIKKYLESLDATN